jgi:hypothetical protein
MSLSRRHLFGLLASAAAAPLLPASSAVDHGVRWVSGPAAFIPNEFFPVRLADITSYDWKGFDQAVRGDQ